MDLTKALDFLEKQGLADCHYQDSGMMEHIAENMQRYADQQLILHGVVKSFVCDIDKGIRCEGSIADYKDGKCKICGQQAN